MDQVLVPAWMFRHEGEYFMVGIEPDGRVRVDGGHSTPQGVANAVELHRSIACIAAPAQTLWCMVKVERIPALKAKVNKKAIRQLNATFTGRKADGGKRLR